MKKNARLDMGLEHICSSIVLYFVFGAPLALALLSLQLHRVHALLGGAHRAHDCADEVQN